MIKNENIEDNTLKTNENNPLENKRNKNILTFISRLLI